MVSRKRAREEIEEQHAADSSQDHGLLHQIRNMWEFANLMQYIYTFGKAMKIDNDIDVEDLEAECLKPGSDYLLNIGLSLLKFVSSYRGLTYENFEEYSRRQYYAKAPTRNPFGDDETPVNFHQLDLCQRIRVLQQLSVWTLWNPDRFRERMPELKETEQTQWRIEELGYDRDDRLYYVLDDNRLYRRTDPPISPPAAARPKATSKRGRAAARAAKRRKVDEDGNEEEQDGDGGNTVQDPSLGYKWECIAASLDEYRTFIEKIKKTRDPNERVLHERLVEQVLPVIEKVEEAQQKKTLRREKELINLQKLATAKRSSRIAGKMNRERQEAQLAEEARKREADRLEALKEEARQEKIEKERQYRLMTREQRLKDREEKRVQQQEELAAMEERAKQAAEGETRISERQFKSEFGKRKKDIEAFEEKWNFDCSGCGIHGENLDDGTHSVACESCNVWQHSQCLGVPQSEAEKDDFHFVCADCQRRVEEAKRPKIPPLRFRVTTPVSSPSKKNTQSPANVSAPVTENPAGYSPVRTAVAETQIKASNENPPGPPVRMYHPISNGPAATSASGALQNGTRPHAAAFTTPIGPSRPMPFVHMNPIPYSTSFNSQPPSSRSGPNAFPSPVQNRPSMSPTQGNRDVGPLAGFPPEQPVVTPSTSFSTLPGTPYHNTIMSSPPRPLQPSNNSPSVSFSSMVPSAQTSFGQTPPSRYSPTMPISGLSPTKHSPARPVSFNDVSYTPVVPPVQKLQPSPKLMASASLHNPVPPPVKNMTPSHGTQPRAYEVTNSPSPQVHANYAQSPDPANPNLPTPSQPWFQTPAEQQSTRYSQQSSLSRPS
ncbi:hypothetical protein FQN57_005153 [Myotisia sp. PD_48]|nr:hypothetical protein FQN57_005153 [Myotisia sp. PD_48]